MDKKTAQILLDNLLARIVIDPKTGQGTFSGILTGKELKALNMALAEFAGSEITDKTSEIEPEIPPHTIVQESEPESLIKPTTKLESSSKPNPQKPPTGSIPETTSESTPTPKIELNLSSLKFSTAQNPKIKLCLDFGTAMSKA